LSLLPGAGKYFGDRDRLCEASRRSKAALGVAIPKHQVWFSHKQRLVLPGRSIEIDPGVTQKFRFESEFGFNYW